MAIGRLYQKIHTGHQLPRAWGLSCLSSFEECPSKPSTLSEPISQAQTWLTCLIFSMGNLLMRKIPFSWGWLSRDIWATLHNMYFLTLRVLLGLPTAPNIPQHDTPTTIPATWCVQSRTAYADFVHGILSAWKWAWKHFLLTLFLQDLSLLSPISKA